MTPIGPLRPPATFVSWAWLGSAWNGMTASARASATRVSDFGFFMIVPSMVTCGELSMVSRAALPRFTAVGISKLVSATSLLEQQLNERV
jgi:hypothetical protein